ncbi:MAG: YbaB/EbfC family nucleoid-associated protein [Candidatus Peribacteraceae bacterium]|nr:YbaB/EbfC family nucleoid-associated protein [Candidatus Peribacteraceae bacterium]
MLGQVRDIYKLQKQAKQIKKELANIHVEAETDGVLVTVNGEMEVISVKIPEAMKSPENAEKLETALVSASNKAIKKAQEIAAEKMKGVMGEMQGLMGGGANPPQAQN